MIENDYFYHGSISPNIIELKTLSLLHNENKKAVYLTDNIPYALFYIWDGKHNNYDRKFVTSWIKNGITYYEELFPMQLEIFYKGVSGYLYCVKKSPKILPVSKNESIYYSEENIFIDRVVFIPDIYSELMKYETLGKFKLLRFNEQSLGKQNELIDKSAGIILKSDFFKNDELKLNFYKKYFPTAWERAVLLCGKN